MSIQDRRELKETAAFRLQQAQNDPRRLVALHTLVGVGAAFLASVIVYLLQMRIGQTGGLSGIGTRSALETVKTVVQNAITLLLPFWQVSLVFLTIRFARTQEAKSADMLEGFRRFGPVLRLRLLQILIYSIIVMPCIYVSAGIFSVTPLSDDFVAILMPIWEQAASQPNLEIDPVVAEALVVAMLPLIPILLVVLLLAVGPVFYRLRLADYVIMDEPKSGALAALIKSWMLTRGNGFVLFQLDLSFWWFFLLQVLAAMLAYVPEFLAAIGIVLPISNDGAYFLFYGLYIAAQCALFWAYGGYVHTTFAVAYETLRENVQNQFPNPGNTPWREEQ